MEKKATLLLGVKNNQVITADVELRDWNGYPEFSACFNVGEAFNIDSIDDDYKTEYFEDVWNCYDAETKLNLLNDGEKTKEDVISDWDYYSDYTEIKDCSCTNYELTNNGKTINFESVCGGQHDVRDDSDFEDMIFTDETLFNNIMYYWDNFHLRQVNDEQIEEIKKLMDSNFVEDSEDFETFIKNNIDWAVL